MHEKQVNTGLPTFLPDLGSGAPQTMSTLEIAEITEKLHKNVIRDTKAMLGALAQIAEDEVEKLTSMDWKNRKDISRFLSHQGISIAYDNRGYISAIHLPKRETLILVSGYDITLRAKIVDRWAELEQSVKPLDYSDPRVVLGVIGHLQEQVQEQAQRLKKLDRLEGAQGSMCISDAAKTLGVGRKQLFDFMSARRWIFKRAGNKNWLAYDDKRKALLLEHDDHLYMDDLGRERVATRVLVTAKGLVKLAELLEQPLH